MTYKRRDPQQHTMVCQDCYACIQENDVPNHQAAVHAAQTTITTLTGELSYTVRDPGARWSSPVVEVDKTKCYHPTE